MTKETREEAEEWRKQHRSKYPAIYNVARLTELPLPMQPIQQCDSSDEMVDRLSISVDRISMGDAGTDAPVREDIVDPLAKINEKTESAETRETVIAENVPLLGENVDENRIVIISDDEEEDGAYGGADRKNQPVPSNSTEPTKPPRSVEVPTLISCKLEYDNFSGFIPFVAGVSVKFK